VTGQIHGKHFPNLGLIIDHQNALLHGRSLSILEANCKRRAIVRRTIFR
jgi:hypothetical protein